MRITEIEKLMYSPLVKYISVIHDSSLLHQLNTTQESNPSKELESTGKATLVMNVLFDIL